LQLARFVKRRIDKILAVASPDAWNYVRTSVNPADMGIQESTVKRSGAIELLWHNGPAFLTTDGIEHKPQDAGSIVLSVTVAEKSLVHQDESALKQSIESCPDLYTLKKRAAYLTAFTEFVCAKAKKLEFKRPNLDAA